ncbi:ABC transporter substrate-binding protein [Actinopolymorpha sp. NPDC004070]|uniref:ABC transporter substrate-binding protein n=1 Tax=Actinopolymorpha sp. NPDC004070 TaxID=3154548 RepID=UPI0033AA13A5
MSFLPSLARGAHTHAPRGHRPLAALLVALLLCAVAGCGTSSGGSGSAAGADANGSDAGKPRAGGNVNFALSLAPACPDPQQATQNMAIYIARQVTDSLTDQDPKTGKIVPWLAKSWEIGKDGREFTFHLRDGVTFSDGTALTAQSVRKNFDSIVHDLGAAAPLASTYLSGYQQTRVSDKLTATVVFAQPNAQFLQATATHSLAIVADRTLATPPEQRCQGKVIGSGPFVVKRFVQGGDVVLAKRKGYAWGSKVFGHTGDAYLDTITYKIVPESGVRAGSLATNQVDAVSDVLRQDEPQIEGAGGKVLTITNPGVVFLLQPNVSREPLKDERVRQAVQLAVNRQEVVDTVLGKHFKAASSVLGRRTPGWTDLSSLLNHDPNRAKALLDAAGWRAGPGGIRVKGGRKLTIDVVYSPNFNGSQPALELVQQQLRQVGIALELRQVTNAQSSEIDQSGDFDTFFYNITRADPDILRTQFSTKLANRGRRAPDQALDPLLDKEVRTLDEAGRDKLVGKAQRLLVEHGYVIPIFELSQAIGVSSRVHGLRFEASSRLQFYDTWISQ